MTARKKTEAIHLLDLTVENFRRLRFAQIKIEKGGKLIRVTGDNFAGKTAVLQAIASLTGGAKKVPKGAMNDEAPEGAPSRIKGRYSNGWTIERKFTTKSAKGYLTAVGPDGESGSQGDLDEWSSGVTADPLFFFSLPQEDQHEILLSFAGTGVKKKLDDLAVKEAALRAERTPFNSEVQKAERTREPDSDRRERLDISAELERLDELRAVQDERLEVERGVREASSAVVTAEETLSDCRKGLAEREEELAAARKTVKDAEADVAQMADRVEGAEERKVDAMVADEELPEDPTEEIQAVRLRIADAESTDTVAREWESYDAVQAEAAEAREEAAKLSKAITSTIEARRKLVAGLKTNVPGLSFDEEGVPLLIGRELHAASGSQRATFAADVAFERNPDLKMVLIDEGEALDDKSIAALARRAKEKDFIVVLCTLGKEGAGEIVVDDGVALSEGQVAP